MDEYSCDKTIFNEAHQEMEKDADNFDKIAVSARPRWVDGVARMIWLILPSLLLLLLTFRASMTFQMFDVIEPHWFDGCGSRGHCETIKQFVLLIPHVFCWPPWESGISRRLKGRRGEAEKGRRGEAENIMCVGNHDW